MSRKLAVLFLFAAAPAMGQVMVAGPRGCGLIDGLTGEAVVQALDEDHMIFDFRALEAIEYHCAFEPAFDPFWETGEIQVRVGYCMEPGPVITPGVFTLLDREDGSMQLDMSFSDAPLLLRICARP